MNSLPQNGERPESAKLEAFFSGTANTRTFSDAKSSTRAPYRATPFHPIRD